MSEGARPLTPDARKREEFTSGIGVKLSDGNVWELPSPVTSCYYPKRDKDGKTGFVQGYNFGSEYDRITDLYVEAEDEDFIGKMSHLVDAVFFVLSKNYDIAFDDMQSLVRFQFDEVDGESGEMWRALSAVVLGRSPKPTPVG